MKQVIFAILVFFAVTTAFATPNVMHTSYLKVLAPHSASVTAKGRSKYDLLFKELPHVFYRAWYKVSTNNSGAGSGEVTVSLTNSHTCKFDIFYSNGWQAINMGSQSYCQATISDKIIGLKAK